MSTRTQSASTDTTVTSRVAARAKRSKPNGDVGEMLLAELAARRARLQELLGLVRKEVAREMAVRAPRRMQCRTSRGYERVARAN
jgi:hypothetical protein